MKYSIRPFVAVTLVMLSFACKNDDDIVPDQDSSSEVTIEGAKYPTVKIGSQTWTTTNYAGPGGVPFDNNNSRPEFGKYYLKEEVEAIALPAGWRLPTQQDYEKLASFQGLSIPSNGTHTENIKSLTSTLHWNHVAGTNISGFNAYPGGYIFQDSAPLPGDIAEFWVSAGVTLSIQEAGAGLTSLRMVFYQSDNSPAYRFNVRFVKD